MCEKLPTSNYRAKKIVKDLGLHYEKIDMCKNYCMIYYKEDVKATQCQVCGLSRWKSIMKGGKGKIFLKDFTIFSTYIKITKIIYVK